MSADLPSHQLLSSVYPQLRRLAAARMTGESAEHTMQATALVHEAWIRLSAHETRSWWGDRGKLFAAASTTMRRILIDRARRRAEKKRGAEWIRTPIENAASIPADGNELMLLVDEALQELEKENPDYARVVVLKIFGGLSMEEIAAEMGVAERTVHRYWARAKVWLYENILK